MGNDFGSFLAVMGFSVMLGITLVSVYVVIRLLEHVWPRRARAGYTTDPSLIHSHVGHPRVGHAHPASVTTVPDGKSAAEPAVQHNAPTPEPAPTAPATVSLPGHDEGEATTALRVLDLRLANGDIDVADYQSRRDALQAGQPAPSSE